MRPIPRASSAVFASRDLGACLNANHAHLQIEPFFSAPSPDLPLLRPRQKFRNLDKKLFFPYHFKILPTQMGWEISYKKN
jgi:hypothetical protein